MNCTIACIARTLDREYNRVDRAFPSKAIHIQEIMDYYYERNAILLQVELKCHVQDKHGHVREIVRNVDRYLEHMCLVYLGDRKIPHMCVWYPELSKTWDPASNRYMIGLPKQTTMIFPIIFQRDEGWDWHG